MSKSIQKLQALEMRKEGNSISDIAQQLSVSKSTVSTWCRDVLLSKSAITKIVKTSERKSTQKLLEYTEGLRLLRQGNIKKDYSIGEKMLGSLSMRDVFCIGLGLYWGEGYKRGSQEFGFTNSDSEMILFYIIWLKKVFSIEKKDLILRVSINQSHADRINDVEDYWSRITGINRKQFTKSSLIKTANKKVYANDTQHFGTLRIKVRKGTRLRRQILGSLQAVSKVNKR